MIPPQKQRLVQCALMLCLVTCFVMAGLVGFEISHADRANSRGVSTVGVDDPRAILPSFQGTIPWDAVIPTPHGYYVPDGKGRFTRVPAPR